MGNHFPLIGVNSYFPLMGNDLPLKENEFPLMGIRFMGNTDFFAGMQCHTTNSDQTATITKLKSDRL